MNDLSPAVRTDHAPATPFGWLRSEIDRLFEDFGRSGRPSALLDPGTPIPPFELVERDKDFRLTAELPGMKDEDVRITVQDRDLVITGEKRQDEDRKGDGFVLHERRYGSFERRIALPASVDAAAIEASFGKGVLTVALPKGADAPDRVRRIDIHKS